MDQRQDHWVTKNGEDESVLVVVRHISLGNAQLAASDVGSARPSTTLQRCAGKGCRVQLVEKESSTLTEPEEVGLLISVEKVDKKLLAQVPFRVGGRTQAIVCQLDTAASCNM